MSAEKCESLTTRRSHAVLIVFMLGLALLTLRPACAAPLSTAEITRLESVGLGGDFLMVDLMDLQREELGSTVNAKLLALGIGVQLFGDDPLSLTDAELHAAAADLHFHLSLGSSLQDVLGVDPNTLSPDELSMRVAAIADAGSLPYPVLPTEIFPTPEKIQKLLDLGVTAELLHLDPNQDFATLLSLITNDELKRRFNASALEQSGILDELLARGIADPFENYVSPDELRDALSGLAREYSGLTTPIPATVWLFAAALVALSIYGRSSRLTRIPG